MQPERHPKNKDSTPERFSALFDAPDGAAKRKGGEGVDSGGIVLAGLVGAY